LLQKGSDKGGRSDVVALRGIHMRATASPL
jgi:hypothetical protein